MTAKYKTSLGYKLGQQELHNDTLSKKKNHILQQYFENIKEDTETNFTSFSCS